MFCYVDWETYVFQIKIKDQSISGLTFNVNILHTFTANGMSIVC